MDVWIYICIILCTYKYTHKRVYTLYMCIVIYQYFIYK